MEGLTYLIFVYEIFTIVEIVQRPESMDDNY